MARYVHPTDCSKPYSIYIDWAGINSRNQFTYNGLSNYAKNTGQPPKIRVGADSEDRTIFNSTVDVSAFLSFFDSCLPLLSDRRDCIPCQHRHYPIPRGRQHYRRRWVLRVIQADAQRYDLVFLSTIHILISHQEHI